MSLTKYDCCPSPQSCHTKFCVPFPVPCSYYSHEKSPRYKSHPIIEIMFASMNKNLKRHQPLDSFNEVRQQVPRRRAEKGQRSSPSELVSRPSVGVWLWVVGQLLSVPTLPKGVEIALGFMTSWLIKAFSPLVEG